MAPKHGTYLRVIEYILFFGLFGISIYFTEEVVGKFLAGKSSFNQSEKSIQELPRITLCFTKPEFARTNYEYGRDFRIKYEIGYEKNRPFVFLENGKKSNVLNEIVFFEKMITKFMGNCYKVTAFTEYSAMMRAVILYFNQTIPYDDLPTLTLFITSEKNSYGAVSSNWKNGKVTKVEIEKGFTKIFTLKADQYNYLSGKCSEEAFYECWGRLLAKELEDVPTKCSPFSLPFLPICKTNETHERIRGEIFANIISKGLCPKLCTTLEYSGFETWNKGITPYYPNATFGFGYVSLYPNTVTIHEEYLIHDMEHMLGSIGGTLGLFIGFSFTTMISCFIKLLEKVIPIIKSLISRTRQVTPQGLELLSLNLKSSLAFKGHNFFRIRTLSNQ